MASLQRKGNSWYCQFIYHGKRHTLTIGPVSDTEASAKSQQVGYLLLRLKQGLIQLPPGIGIVEFMQRDGKWRPETSVTSNGPTELSLVNLRDQYLATNRSSQEPRSIEGIELH